MELAKKIEAVIADYDIKYGRDCRGVGDKIGHSLKE
jgi:hypothetical protein